MQNCNADNGAASHFKICPAKKDLVALYTTNYISEMSNLNDLTKRNIFLQRSCCCRDCPAGWDHSNTIRWETGFADYVGSIEDRRSRQHFPSLSFQRSGQPHDASSSGSPCHEKTKQFHSKGHFLKLFVLWVPFSPKIAFLLALSMCMPIDKLPSRKAWLRGL